MKNVALSADEDLIEQARLVARQQHGTLNAASGSGSCTSPPNPEVREKSTLFMDRLRRVNAGRRFGREEMNER
jgi:hypothetical protein